ncbi:MAG: hypothetical protein ACYCXT_11945 [Acidiferrobacteraceae bacterium]
MLTMFRLAIDEEELGPDGGGIPIPATATSMCTLATGRSALTHLIRRLPSPHAKTVLLPSYVAEGVIQPFLAAGFSVLFYRLRADLSPMADDIESLLEQIDGTATVVVIHYFGFLQRSPGLSLAIARHNAVVVDDCAHAIFTSSPSGRPLAEEADLCLYSLNKFLPVVDGATLISMRPDVDLALDESQLSELPEEAQQRYQDHLQAGRDIFDSHNPTQAQCFLKELESSYERYYGIINSDLVPYRQSARSRRMAASFPYNRLIQRRLLNSQIVYERLKSPIFTLVYPVLPAGVVPWCIPARVPAPRRSEILDKLFAQDILLSTLQDKWDFIPTLRRDHYMVESAFLDEHVLIPISEFITPAFIQDMVKRLNGIH